MPSEDSDRLATHETAQEGNLIGIGWLCTKQVVPSPKDPQPITRSCALIAAT